MLRTVFSFKRAVTAGIAAATLAFSSAGTLAANAPIAASLYPAGAHISYRPDLSNLQMDCMWGFLCDGGVVLFHTTSESTLHRLSGWGEFASSGVDGPSFELFASRYGSGTNFDGTPWAQAAFADLALASRTHGYRTVHLSQIHHTSLDPTHVLTAQVPCGASNLLVMAWWDGTAEVEAIVAYNRKPAAERRIAVTDLVRQVDMATQWPD